MNYELCIILAIFSALIGGIIGALIVRSKKEALRERCDMLSAQIETERAHSEALRAEDEQQWEQRLASLRQEMQNLTSETLTARQASLQENNRVQMDELLKPIREQFIHFSQTVNESRTQNEVNKQELKSSFESCMKLFQQQQQMAIASLREQTERIGTDATNLTRALKSDSKMQGDWGEMVLETLLENSGLHRNEEYFIQENVQDAEGRNFRPDVIVRFPEGRSIVIDSKVSLTNYADAVAADGEQECQRLLHEHARSMRRHVDELAAKNYDKIVEDAIGFVLMFVPNENSYIAAMKQQPDLSRYAYQKHIIILSPSNLLMALQLAYNLWQYDRQNKNVEKIVKTAADLYDKVASFADTFEEISVQIEKLRQTYSLAHNRLYEGKGNIMRRIESLKDMGVTPKKQLRQSETTLNEIDNSGQNGLLQPACAGTDADQTAADSENAKRENKI